MKRVGFVQIGKPWTVIPYPKIIAANQRKLLRLQPRTSLFGDLLRAPLVMLHPKVRMYDTSVVLKSPLPPRSCFKQLAPKREAKKK